MCPSCSAQGLKPIGDGKFKCQYCDAIVVKQSVNCPTCGLINSTGDENCFNCGEPLTIIGQIMSRHTGDDQPLRLKQMRSQASALKERDAEPSRRRMEKFQETDRRREQSVYEAMEAQKVSNRRISTVLLAVAGLFILFVIVFTVLYLN